MMACGVINIFKAIQIQQVNRQFAPVALGLLQLFINGFETGRLANPVKPSFRACSRLARSWRRS